MVHPAPEANPIALWKLQIGNIRDIQIGPKSKNHLACFICEYDLKIIDFNNSKIIVTLPAYFAGFQCVCWSEDGEIIVAGGEDDCIHVWNANSWELICRGISHSSWVSCVFCQQNDFGYIVSSVAHDGIMCIWDILQPANNEKHEEASVIEYPKRSQQHLIEPITEVKVSEEPLVAVCVHNNNYFVCDMSGLVIEWI